MPTYISNTYYFSFPDETRPADCARRDDAHHSTESVRAIGGGRGRPPPLQLRPRPQEIHGGDVLQVGAAAESSKAGGHAQDQGLSASRDRYWD